MTVTSSVDFFFRVWLYPEDGDPPEIEVWYHGLENTEDKSKGWMSDWARESLQNEDFRDLLNLDKDKHYQIVGKGAIRGWYDYQGEYDEEFDLGEHEITEVPESYWDNVSNLEERFKQAGEHLTELAKDGTVDSAIDTLRAMRGEEPVPVEERLQTKLSKEDEFFSSHARLLLKMVGVNIILTDEAWNAMDLRTKCMFLRDVVEIGIQDEQN